MGQFLINPYISFPSAVDPEPVGGAQMIVGFDIDGYETYTHRLELTLDTPADSGNKTLAAGVNTWTFSGLAYNTQYNVDIIRIDPSLNESSPLEAAIYTQPEFGPTGLTASVPAGVPGESTINLSWSLPTPEPISGYQIDTSADGITWAYLDDVAAGTSAYSATGLTSESEYYFRVRGWNDNPSPHDDAVTAWSNVDSETTAADVTPPTLSDPIASQTGPTTGTVGVTTSDASGTLYWYVSTSGTPPSASDLKAGTGATFSASDTIVSSGAKTKPVTGLTTGVTYYCYTLHRDPAGNDSTIATSAGFTPSVSYIIAENFESGSLPAGWVVLKGTPDYNVTPALEGSKSLGLFGKTAGDDVRVQSITFTPSGEVEVYIKLKISDMDSLGSANFLVFQSNLAQRALVLLTTNKLRVGGVGGSNVDTVGTLTTGTLYHIWARYSAGSGSDGIISVAFSTDGIRPTSGNNFAEINTGANTGTVDRIYLYGDYVSDTASYDLIIDRFLTLFSPIGNNP